MVLRRLIGLLLLAAGALAQNPETAVFPGSVATDAELLCAGNSAETRLNLVGGPGSVLAADATTIPVVDAAAFCAPSTITIRLERIRIASISANDLIVASGGRGVEGTTASVWLHGSTVRQLVTAYWFNQMAAEVKSIESVVDGLSSGSGITCTGTPTALQVAAGVLTITGSACFTVNTEADAATDDIDVMNCTAGWRFELMPVHDSRTVIIKKGAGILVPQEFHLDNIGDRWLGHCPNTNVVSERGRSDNGG